MDNEINMSTFRLIAFPICEKYQLPNLIEQGTIRSALGESRRIKVDVTTVNYSELQLSAALVTCYSLWSL